MSVKYTKEFKMIENNGNKKKRKFMISFTSQTELAGKWFAGQESANCTKQCVQVT